MKQQGELPVKVIHYSDAPAKRFDTLPAKGVTGRVVIGKDDGARNFCMRVFELSSGGHTPLHVHDWEHEIFVHAGEGSVFKEGAWVPLSPGNVVFISSNEEHQIRNTGSAPLVFVCLIPSGVAEI
jgi:quercetin dioxygenase-like cupin family protein